MDSPPRSDALIELQAAALATRGLRDGLLEEPPPRLPVGGTELIGYRDYTVGDDPRHLDWNVCARHDELRVRLFGGRRDCHVRVLLDCSASMAVGSSKTKFQAARRITAAVAFAAIDRQARLSILPFSDRLLDRIGPIRGQARSGLLLRQLETLPRPEGATDFRRVAETLVRIDATSGPTVIVSDFCDPDAFRSGLDVLRLAGRPVRIVHLVDPDEDRAVTPGDIHLADAESDAAWQVTLTRRQLRRYRELLIQDRERPRQYCRKYRLPYVRTGIRVPSQRELANILAARNLSP